MAHRGHAGAVRIGPAHATSVAGACRVAAEVDGVPVWFESPDCSLRPAPEAFGSAFLLPALHRRVRLAMSDPVDGEWLAGIGALERILRRWWGYRVLAPDASASPAPPGVAAPRGTGLFFSGGVDSFYSLLCTDARPDRLIMVQGFDIALEDRTRMAAAGRTLHAVGEARGVRTITVRTNLRAHPLLEGVPWERTHGGALAAVGHALGDEVSEVTISSSISRDRDRAWGSHWETDPLFSSSRLRFRQVGMELRRAGKLRHIAGEPLVRRNLRVCWENRTPDGNCSRCSKCAMTRLALADLGVLESFPVFDGGATLARDLDAIRSLGGRLRLLEELSVSPRLAPEVGRAARELLRRSRHAQSPGVRARRALVRGVFEWTGGARS